MVICNRCSGFGKLLSRPICNETNQVVFAVEIECDLCYGTGKISSQKLEWIAQGKKLREYRLKVQSLSIRSAAKRLGIDSSNLSKMERGVIKPINVWSDV